MGNAAPLAARLPLHLVPEHIWDAVISFVGTQAIIVGCCHHDRPLPEPPSTPAGLHSPLAGYVLRVPHDAFLLRPTCQVVAHGGRVYDARGEEIVRARTLRIRTRVPDCGSPPAFLTVTTRTGRIRRRRRLMAQCAEGFLSKNSRVIMVHDLDANMTEEIVLDKEELQAMVRNWRPRYDDMDRLFDSCESYIDLFAVEEDIHIRCTYSSPWRICWFDYSLTHRRYVRYHATTSNGLWHTTAEAAGLTYASTIVASKGLLATTAWHYEQDVGVLVRWGAEGGGGAVKETRSKHFGRMPRLVSDDTLLITMDFLERLDHRESERERSGRLVQANLLCSDYGRARVLPTRDGICIVVPKKLMAYLVCFYDETASRYLGFEEMLRRIVPLRLKGMPNELTGHTARNLIIASWPISATYLERLADTFGAHHWVGHNTDGIFHDALTGSPSRREGRSFYRLSETSTPPNPMYIDRLTPGPFYVHPMGTITRTPDLGDRFVETRMLGERVLDILPAVHPVLREVREQMRVRRELRVRRTRETNGGLCST